MLKIALLLLMVLVAIYGLLAYLGRNPTRHPETNQLLQYTGLNNSVQSRMTETVARLLAEGVHPDPPAGPHAAESTERLYATVPTPLQSASMTGQVDIVRLLLDANANPNLRHSGGESAVYFAAEAGHLEVTLILLEAGAHPALAGPGGTPAEVAEENGHSAIARALADRTTPPD